MPVLFFLGNLQTFMLIKVEPHSTNICFIRTLVYNGQFHLSKSSYIFPNQPTQQGHQLVWTTDTFLCPKSQSQSCISSTALYGLWLSVHCLFKFCHSHVLIVDIVLCLNDDIFLWVYTVLLLKKRNNSMPCLILISPSLFLCLAPTLYGPLIKFCDFFVTTSASLAFFCSVCSYPSFSALSLYQQIMCL